MRGAHLPPPTGTTKRGEWVKSCARLLPPYLRAKARGSDEECEGSAFVKRELRTDSEPVIVDDAQLADDRRGGILNPRQCLLEQRLPYAVHVEGIEVLDDRGV